MTTFELPTALHFHVFLVRSQGFFDKSQIVGGGRLAVFLREPNQRCKEFCDLELWVQKDPLGRSNFSVFSLAIQRESFRWSHGRAARWPGALSNWVKMSWGTKGFPRLVVAAGVYKTFEECLQNTSIRYTSEPSRSNQQSTISQN